MPGRDANGQGGHTIGGNYCVEQMVPGKGTPADDSTTVQRKADVATSLPVNF